LAVIGVALAVPQLIDRPAAGALLQWAGMPLPTGDEQILILLGTQLGITLTVAFFVGLAIKYLHILQRV
jgi:hypothetical protein